jgi:succinate dehydrogenase hydrophobic anchor subunit
MTSQRAFWVLLGAAAALTVADMLFSVTVNLISPGAPYTAWQARTTDAVWLASVLLAVAAVLTRLRRKS